MEIPRTPSPPPPPSSPYDLGSPRPIDLSDRGTSDIVRNNPVHNQVSIQVCLLFFLKYMWIHY